MTDIDYSICETQARLFKYIVENNYDIEDFIVKYMKSDFCKRAMDTMYSRFQSEDEEECLDFIIPEIGTLKENINKYYNIDEIYWIGFIYRQLYIETSIPSSKLIDILPLKTMHKYYPGLHTVEENMQADIICENFNLSKNYYIKNI